MSGHRSVRITGVETLRCGAGFRDFCFVKMTTDAAADSEVDGRRKPIVGWSEYLEGRKHKLDVQYELRDLSF